MFNIRRTRKIRASLLDQHQNEIKQLKDEIASLVARVTRCEDIIIESDAEDEVEAAVRPAKKARKGKAKGKGTDGKGDNAEEVEG